MLSEASESERLFKKQFAYIFSLISCLRISTQFSLYSSHIDNTFIFPSSILVPNISLSFSYIAKSFVKKSYNILHFGSAIFFYINRCQIIVFSSIYYFFIHKHRYTGII